MIHAMFMLFCSYIW